MIRVSASRCTGCGACVEVCPNDALWLVNGIATFMPNRCTSCGRCIEACPAGAIEPLADSDPGAKLPEAVDAKVERVWLPEERPSSAIQARHAWLPAVAGFAVRTLLPRVLEVLRYRVSHRSADRANGGGRHRHRQGRWRKS